MEESFKAMLRKKVLELKSTESGFYTETYNIVYVLAKLSPDAPKLINERLSPLYSRPSLSYSLSLPQLEQLYFKYKEDVNLKIKSKIKIDIYDIKACLDKTRRDLLFFLAVLEDMPKNYDIMEEG